MRKILISVLVIILMATTMAYAETIDLQSMTTDELLTLRNQINDILNERMMTNTSSIYSGMYIVGTDIKAGRYVFEFGKLAEMESTGVVMIFENYEAYKNRNYIIADYIRLGVEYQVALEEGMVLEITRGSGTIYSITTPDWAP